MPRKGQRPTPEALARIKRGSERGKAAANARREYERELLRVAPSDLAALRDSGIARKELLSLVLVSAEEHRDLLEALGGEDGQHPTP